MIHAGRHTRRQKEWKRKRGVTRRGCNFEKKKTEISSFVFFNMFTRSQLQPQELHILGLRVSLHGKWCIVQHVRRAVELRGRCT